MTEPITSDGGKCHRFKCEGRVVVARIMRWCAACKWTGLA